MNTLHEAFEEISCNFCGKNDFEEIYKSTLPQDLSLRIDKRFAPADHVNGNDRLVRCKNCFLIFANPRMKQDYIWEGYASAEDQRYVTQSDTRLTTFQKTLKKIEKYTKKLQHQALQFLKENL